MKSNQDFEKYSYIEEYQGSYLWLIFIIALILLVFIMIGIAYSFYNYTIRGKKEQPILTDILFHYSDLNGSENGIFIEDAKEMNDEVGKKLTGSGNSFEFTVSGNPKSTKSQYTIVVDSDSQSTISDSDVKLYLTRVQGTVETDLLNQVPVYSDLEKFSIEGKTYRKLYSVILTGNEGDFSHDYILRMWIRSGATDYYKKNYSLKIHVLAEGIGEE